MTVKLRTEHHLEFLTLKGCCTDSSEYTHVKMSRCKSHVMARMFVVICGAGYQPNSNGTACEPCPIGKFKDSEGVGYCKDCLMNRTTMEVGAINRTTDCVSKYFNP